MKETQSTSFETHRVGDIHDGLTTVAVNPSKNLAIVRDVVERGVLPKQKKYRWLGHGMNTCIVESVKLGLHCGACGQLRTSCRCGEAEAVRALSVVKSRREAHGWEAAAERAARKIVSEPTVVSQGFAVNREAVMMATRIPENYTSHIDPPASLTVNRGTGFAQDTSGTMSAMDRGSGFDQKPSGDAEWSCKRCGQRTITARRLPEPCGCGCAYFDRVGAA